MHLAIRGVSKTYPNGVRALRDVTLDIPRGMFGLLGPNGAGKSTLMRTIATLQEPDTGSITLGRRGAGPGEAIDVIREKDRLRRTLGYLPQEFGVYPGVSAERLLDHFAVLEGFRVLQHARRQRVRHAPGVGERKAEYERRYKRFEHAPTPSPYAARLHVELYPSERAAHIQGTFRLVNRAGRAIDSINVLPSLKVETRDLRFDRAARLVLDDSLLRYRIYALKRPLAPGDSMAMTFELVHRPRGFPNSGAATDVTPNGIYIEGDWLPALGYLLGRELPDGKTRHERGLPPRTLAPSAGDVETRAGVKPAQLVDVETVIGSDPRHTAVTPGRLVREWAENGRRYHHYRTDEPIRYGGAILSAEYAVRRDTAQGVALAVYYHPAHDVNVDRMIRSMRASLAYFGEQFGPYQYRELRIVEFPRYASFARAHPHTITFSEGSAFLTRVDSGDVDCTFFVVAHETAHQWCGGQVIPVSAPGAGFVSESVAQYSAMMVLETSYGVEMARAFYDYNMEKYFQGRSVYTNREVPLLDVVSQSYVYYFRGASRCTPSASASAPTW